MTAAVNIYPPLELRATVANPITVGTLYTAAALEEMRTPARIEGGARIEQTNAGDGYGTWPLECPTPQDATEKTGERAGALEFDAFAAWAVDECSLIGTSEQEVTDLATQRLRLTEERSVGLEFADTLLERAGTPADAAAGGIVGAVGAIEEALGATGIRGVVHAARKHIAAIASKGMIVRSNSGRLETPGGHFWAFGLGYEALDDNLVATGPVTIYRTPVVVTPSVDHRQNHRTALAEREIMPTYELFAVAHKIGV